MKILQIFFVTLLAFSVAGFTTQPLDERQAQEALPKSQDPLWQVLGTSQATFNEKTAVFDVTHSPEVQKLSGQTVTLSGFMLPLEGSEYQRHFLLSKRTPTCPFCMAGGPNEVVEVFATAPIFWAEDEVKVQGEFVLLPVNEQGMLFQIKNAKEIKN